MMQKAINLKITLPMKAQPKHSLTKVFLQTAKLEVHIENILSYKIALPTKSRRKHPKKSDFFKYIREKHFQIKKKKKTRTLQYHGSYKSTSKELLLSFLLSKLGTKTCNSFRIQTFTYMQNKIVF